MRNKGWGIWATPLLLALPLALAMGFAAVKYGDLIRNLIHLAVKLVVTK